MLQQVNEVVAFAGDPSKLLYGTDWPICDMGSYKRFVKNLHLSPDETEQVMWKNSARLFRIDPLTIREEAHAGPSVPVVRTT
jgi:predicted TIM-barrel fold metal-dependent hydrolase